MAEVQVSMSMEELVKGDFIFDINEELGENSEWTIIDCVDSRVWQRGLNLEQKKD